MLIHRIDKKNLTSVSYVLLYRSTIRLKFKLLLYSKDKNLDLKYFQQDYILNGDKISTSLSPKSCIELSISDNEKNIVYINEIFQNRYLRKLSKLVNILDGYDSNEIDILITDQNGTRLFSELCSEIVVSYGSQLISFTPFWNGDNGKVQIRLKINESQTVISIDDMISLYYKIKEINFTTMTMQLLNWCGHIELGENVTDFRTVNKNSFDSSLIEIQDSNQYKPKW